MNYLALRDAPTLSVRSTIQRIVRTASPRQRRAATIAATVAIAGIAAMATPDPAYAQSANLEGFAKNVLGLLSNGLLRALAVIAVIIAGAGWLMGRVNTGALVTVIIGIAIIFSAPWIVDQIAGSA